LVSFYARQVFLNEYYLFVLSGKAHFSVQGDIASSQGYKTENGKQSQISSI
jgi:hypothetical protein